jgi:hypothetical protein
METTDSSLHGDAVSLTKRYDGKKISGGNDGYRDKKKSMACEFANELLSLKFTLHNSPRAAGLDDDDGKGLFRVEICP